MNNVVLIGRLTRDPEMRYVPSGTATTNFTLAVDKGLSKEKKQEMESKNQATADFIRIVVWGKTAENCANYLVKGRLVGVQGRIATGSYEKDGRKIYTTDVVANQVEFLEWGDSEKGKSNQSSDSNTEDYGGFDPAMNADIPF